MPPAAGHGVRHAAANTRGAVVARRAQIRRRCRATRHARAATRSARPEGERGGFTTRPQRPARAVPRPTSSALSPQNSARVARPRAHVPAASADHRRACHPQRGRAGVAGRSGPPCSAPRGRGVEVDARIAADGRPGARRCAMSSTTRDRRLTTRALTPPSTRARTRRPEWCSIACAGSPRAARPGPRRTRDPRPAPAHRSRRPAPARAVRAADAHLGVGLQRPAAHGDLVGRAREGVAEGRLPAGGAGLRGGVERGGTERIGDHPPRRPWRRQR